MSNPRTCSHCQKTFSLWVENTFYMSNPRNCSHCQKEVTVCCSVLQCAAVWCSALQCVAVRCSVMRCVAAWCSVLQCVVLLQCLIWLFYWALQSLSERRMWTEKMANFPRFSSGWLQRVAACCSVLQRVAATVGKTEVDRKYGLLSKVFFRSIVFYCSVLQRVAAS